MEEDNNNPQPQADFSPQRTQVSFPGEKKEKKSKKGLFIIILLIVGVLLGGGFYFFRNRGSEDSLSEPTPTLSETEITSTPTKEPIDKGEVSIEVMNGSGVSGEAAKLKSVLAELGYTDIEVGNAGSSDYVTTEVSFKSSIDDEVKDEIIEELENIYSSVEVKDGSIGDKDVEIIIGYKKGFTPTPKPKATVTPTKAPTASVSATVTPTKTPTPSPTP